MADPAAGVGVLAAVFAGMVSVLSPCVLPLVPGYLSAVTGVSSTELDRAPVWRVLGPSLLFIASFSSMRRTRPISAAWTLAAPAWIHRACSRPARCAGRCSTRRSTPAAARSTCASAARSTASSRRSSTATRKRYVEIQRYNKPGERPLRLQTEATEGCPRDCGICPEHKQHTCLGIIEVNTGCNLTLGGRIPEFHEIVYARVRDGVEEEMLSRRPVLEEAVREAGEIHGFLEETLAHHRGEVAVA